MMSAEIWKDGEIKPLCLGSITEIRPKRNGIYIIFTFIKTTTTTTKNKNKKGDRRTSQPSS